jgi:hypothetical protein
MLRHAGSVGVAEALHTLMSLASLSVAFRPRLWMESTLATVVLMASRSHDQKPIQFSNLTIICVASATATPEWVGANST